MEATAADDESVVGDECHIVSRSGPRKDPDYPSEKLDDYSNLLLLCKTDHKLVDDQERTYASDNLRQCKSLHEKWVADTLSAGRMTPRVSLARLPVTGHRLFGRDRELQILTDAWNDKDTNVFSVVAFGGVGKSSLVNRWLRDIQLKDYLGAMRVFGWSFYSQGFSQGRQSSGDAFADAALNWFGDSDPTEGSLWDRGERLAQLVRAQRSLLILDGVEPLQSPPGPSEGGWLRDQILQSLLRELAAYNPGLCVITTRLAIADLKGHFDSGSQRMDLETLSNEAGAQLLSDLGVTGTASERLQAVDEFGGHALALTLLGRYLATVHHGDVGRRDQIGALTADSLQGGHARRIIESYERWFEGKPEQLILRLLGLFDRPADKDAVTALCCGEPIPELTLGLRNPNEANWRFAVATLRDARLLFDPDAESPETLDCHPIVREYFADRLRSEYPEAWRLGNGRLFDHLQSTIEYQPETLEGLMPLYAAVAHGCSAGRHMDALADVYIPRICRNDQYFATQNLGGFGADLNCLASFFESSWDAPVATIPTHAQAWLLNQAGYALRALGRLAEASIPIKAALDSAVAIGEWERAAIRAGTLYQIHLFLGGITEAVSGAQEAVRFAQQSCVKPEQIAKLSFLAHALHYAGERKRAKEVFCVAEDLQHDEGFPVLMSLQGYRYCELLLDLRRASDVIERATVALQNARTANWPLDIALDQLSLGRALLQLGEDGALEHLQQTVAGLRKFGQTEELPRGLIGRAECLTAIGDHERARADLEESLLVCARVGLRLHEADTHLGFARLHIAVGDEAEARRAATSARNIVAETGYHRRDKELAELQARL